MADPGKGILIILLVIIGIGLVLYFLVNNINIPPAQWAPFVDGTKVRIRSLITDQYLVATGRNRSREPIQGISGSTVSFTGSRGAESVWQLCQNTSSTQNRGRYLLFRFADQNPGGTYLRNIRRSIFPIIQVNNAVSCPNFKEGRKTATEAMRLDGLFFQLVEDGSTNPLFGGIASNVYNILDSSSRYMEFDPQIQSDGSVLPGSVATWIKEPLVPNDVRWSFVIEYVSQG